MSGLFIAEPDEGYDAGGVPQMPSPNYQIAQSDIYRRINAMLENATEAYTGDQQKFSLPPMPSLSGPHSQQQSVNGGTSSCHDNQYQTNSNGHFSGFQLFYPNSTNPQQQQQQQPSQQQFYGQTYQYNEPYTVNPKFLQHRQTGDQYSGVPYKTPKETNNNLVCTNDSAFGNVRLSTDVETPMKPIRAIRGSPNGLSYSAYEGINGTPTLSENNDSLSPIEKMFGRMSCNTSRSTSTPIPESDSSGLGSEGSDMALMDMMQSLKLQSQDVKSPVTDLSKQLYIAQQQQQQHQQQAAQQQQQQLLQYYQQQQQQATHHHQHQQQLIEFYQQQHHQQQQHQQQKLQPQQPQQSFTNNAVSSIPSVPAGQQVIGSGANGVLRPYVIANLDPYSVDRAARLHRSAAALCEATCTWSGKIPPKNVANATTFSCKVFLGGVPWDITEVGLKASFNRFGLFNIEWPGRDGYVYLLFESDKSVRALLQECNRDSRSGEYFFNISSRRMRSKEVQVIPWLLSDSNFVRQLSQRLDSNKTVFVGALHGMITAEVLAGIMNDLFGNVVYAGIDCDKHKYPIGSGRVTFSSRRSYMRAVQAAFVEVKTPKFTKKLQLDPYLEDSQCSLCGVQSGSYFCRDFQCFNYFCRTCWYWNHEPDSLRNHKPLARNIKGQANVALF